MNAKRLPAMFAALTVCAHQCAADERPEWAFFVPTADAAALVPPPALDLGSPQTAPGSRQTYTLGQVMDVLNPPDWYPKEHPPMPAIVAHGGASVPVGSIARGRSLAAGIGARTAACAGCHGSTLNGIGEIPPLAGRPHTYLVRQLWNYQSGDRRGSVAAPMWNVVARLRVDEMLAIAAYLSSLPPAGH